MSARDPSTWSRLTRDNLDSLARGAAADLDAIDTELTGLRRLRHQELRASLERLGFDVSEFTEPPYPTWAETRSSRHPEPFQPPWLRAAAARAKQRGGLIRSWDSCGIVEIR